MNGIVSSHIIVAGRVQGVGFRYSALYFAKSLGLKGWVRNLSNGNVEAIAQGPEVQVSKFEGWMSKGPATAYVSHIQKKRIQPKQIYKSFSITY